jgi:hypothetical protein
MNLHRKFALNHWRKFGIRPFLPDFEFEEIVQLRGSLEDFSNGCLAMNELRVTSAHSELSQKARIWFELLRLTLTKWTLQMVRDLIDDVQLEIKYRETG